MWIIGKSYIWLWGTYVCLCVSFKFILLRLYGNEFVVP